MSHRTHRAAQKICNPAARHATSTPAHGHITLERILATLECDRYY